MPQFVAIYVVGWYVHVLFFATGVMKLKHILLSAGIIVLSLVSAAIGALLSRHVGVSTYAISYADFISVMLTAISLLMTLLAFFIAILALVGWNTIADRVRDATREFLEGGIKENGAIYTILKQTSERVTYEGVSEFRKGEDNEEDGKHDE